MVPYVPQRFSNGRVPAKSHSTLPVGAGLPRRTISQPPFALSPRLLLRAYRIQYPEITIVTRSSVSPSRILPHSCSGFLVPWLRRSRTAPIRCVVKHCDPAPCCAHQMAARLVVDLVVKQRRALREMHGRRRNEIRSAAFQVRMLEVSRLSRIIWDGRWCMIRGVFGRCIGASRIRCRDEVI